MTTIAALALVGFGIFLGVEYLRWKLRPEERRLRLLNKIGGRQ